MQRTLEYQLVHVVVILGSMAVVVSLLIALRAGLATILLVGLAFLIPGRIQGLCWRTFFRGRRALGAGQSGKAVEHFESFLEELEQHPRLKWLVWFAGAAYTRDIEVMTLNNLGAAHLQGGDWDRAEEHFEKAIRRDPQCPLPYFNLAILNQARGDAEKAQRTLQKANELGYRRTSVDHLIEVAGALLARVEGR